MEFVLVVPRTRLFPECFPQGFSPFGPGALTEFLATVDEHGFFVERQRAEREPAWKQVIPYVAVSQGAAPGERLFAMRRLTRGGEARLHGKRSLGVGGHVNPEDAFATSAVEAATNSPTLPQPRSRALLHGALREISEEIRLTTPGSKESSAATSPALIPLGLINDDATAVGAVHVGLACVLHTTGDVSVREDDVLSGELLEPAVLRRLRDEGADFESWSSCLLDALWPTDGSDAIVRLDDAFRLSPWTHQPSTETHRTPAHV
ncbi:MAG: hypothetical protein WD226_04380 [Planctomycetota bacterium]